MPFFRDMEDKFAASGRTPKGQRALRGIFRALRDIIAEDGLREASLDRIADHAGLTQAAVRHYFATREALLTSYFATATEWFQGNMAALLTESPPPRNQLERCVTWHLEYMENVDTIFWLEASAFWLRQKTIRRTRDEWYGWLASQYAALVGHISPQLNVAERERRAYAILTLILGAWITHGRGSAIGNSSDSLAERQLLIDVAMDIASH